MRKSGRHSRSTRADVLLHPVRLRIVKAMESERMTAGQIAEHLPDVPLATLYRQITHLKDAGIIDIVERHQVHGTVERVFALVRSETILSYEDLKQASPTELAQFVRLFMAEIMSSFDRYILNGTPDLERDQVVFYEQIVHLHPDEAAEVREQMRNLLHRYVSNSPDEGRQPYNLSVFSVPEIKPTTALRNEGTTLEND